tara:strand:- start:644 stop:856 length:213 start_codon:yes stop_codon:yes gene_type:complete
MADTKISETLSTGYLEEARPWQVIYKTPTQDYCRETYSPDFTLLEICNIADREIADREPLARALIERWGG